jgi:hypothetical protein
MRKMFFYVLVEETGPSKRKWRMGFKEPFPLLKSIGNKNVWRLIQRTSLWVEVIKSKYIAPDTIKEWIKKNVKRVHLVGNWLICKVEKCK